MATNLELLKQQLNEMATAVLAEGRGSRDDLTRLGYQLARCLVHGHALYLPVGFGDKVDLIQSGILGFLEAMRDWKPEEGAFAKFAWLCVDREIISALIVANRRKHEIANNARSLQAPLRTRRNDSEPLTLFDIIKVTGDGGENPADALLTTAELAEAKGLLHRLCEANWSDLERHVLNRCVLGQATYKAAAAEAGVHWKSIDNASQRVMRKLRARALELSFDERYSPQLRAALKRCSVPAGPRGGRPTVTAWIGDLAEGA